MKDYKIDYVGIGSRIREKRVERKMTLDEFGDRTGLPMNFLRGIETGRVKINMDGFIRIMDVLQVPADELLRDNFRCDGEG